MTLVHPNDLQPRDNLLWVGIDLDGTLAEGVWTPANPTQNIGDPIRPNVEKLEELYFIGYKIHIHSSRPWTDFERVESWLKFWEIPFNGIQLGKPLYVAYVDDRAVPEYADWLVEVRRLGGQK